MKAFINSIKTIKNYIIVIIITIILIKNSNNNILFWKTEKKRFLAYCPKVTSVGTRFEPAIFELPTYLFNYLTRPNDLGYSDYLYMLVFLLAYNRRFDYKVLLTLFYCT